MIKTEKQLTKVWEKLRREGLEPIITQDKSMIPVIMPNHLVAMTFLDRELREGDIVAFEDPEGTGRIIIKFCDKIREENGQKHYRLAGYNVPYSKVFEFSIGDKPEQAVFKLITKYPNEKLSDSLIDELLKLEGGRITNG